jgi:hypothetical protein
LATAIQNPIVDAAWVEEALQIVGYMGSWIWMWEWDVMLTDPSPTMLMLVFHLP